MLRDFSAPQPRRSRPRRWLSLCVALTAAGCRIQRELPAGSGGSAGAPAERAAREPGAPGRAAPEAQSSEALSLWVLNRSEAELAARGAVPAAEPAPAPVPALLVVLGTERGRSCAQAIARTARARLEQGEPIEHVAREALARAAQIRWRHAAANARYHVAWSSSVAGTAGVQSAPLWPFPDRQLDRARRSGGVVDAQRLPAPAAAPDAGVPALPSGCESSELAAGPGTVAVLAGVGRHFVSGLVQLQADSDAGLLGYAAQPSSAVAAGQAGALAIVGSCSFASETAGAEALYAELAAGHAPAAPGPGTCERAYALLTPAGPALLAPASLAGGAGSEPAAAVEPAVPPPAAPPPAARAPSSAHAPADAGAGGSGAAP
ncbi:MAG TPA: hypothetical protein VFS67_23095 [Polyangiaceae bacterium]|nr:hypothetical protein [Polyangiaceae bacterium]